MISPSESTLQGSGAGHTSASGYVQEWLESVRDLGVAAFVVLGPDPIGDPSQRYVYTVQPPERGTDASHLCTSDAYGTAWRASNSPLVGWSRLGDLDSQAGGSWVRGFLDAGLTGLVRVEIPLPMGRAFECFLFCAKPIADRQHAANVSYALHSSWPSIKQEITYNRLGITDREREGLIAAAHGLTAQQASLRMGCTSRTVQFHWANAMRKLSSENKVAAVLRASFIGLI